MKNSNTLVRLMRYMWRYKLTTAMALLFILLASVTATIIPLIARFYIDAYMDAGIWANGLWLIASYYGLFLLHVVFNFVGNYAFSVVANSVVRDLRNEAFRNVQRLEMRYFDTTPAGAIVSRLTNDTQAVADMFSAIFSSFLSSLLIVVTTLSAMFSLNVPLTFLMILFLPVMYGSVQLYHSRSHELIRMTRSKLSDLNVALAEGIEGMKIIQSFNQESRLKEEFEAINGEHLDYANRTLNVNSLFLRPAMSLLKLVAYAVILFYFGVTGSIVGVTAGVMYAFIQYSNQLFNPLIEVTQNFSVVQTSMIAAKRVFEVIDREDYEPVQTGKMTEIRDGKIEFRNVSFSYDGKRDVLSNISFTVNPGETVAFVGSTGSGKSSIMNVFLRFYEFDRGEVLIDGHSIRDYSKEALRRSVGLVLQDPFLFHGTVASNIRMYQDLNETAVREAGEFVDAHFIEELPDKYESNVTERGTTFSSGERQLMAFARTIAANPQILILDEATANIDSQTEEVIQQSLSKMRQGRTTLAIAHRLSTIQDADCIHVLDRGRIVESGTHQELLNLHGQYYKMYELQKGGTTTKE